VFVAVIWFVLGRTESVPSAFRTRTDGLVVLALACIWFPHVIETIYSLFESQSPSSANVSEAMGCLIRVVGWGMLIIMLIVRIAAALPS